MTARIWHARATPDGAVVYRQHFSSEVLSTLRQVSGFNGATVLERRADGHVEITVITRWESMDAIRRFAGADVTVAVVTDEAKQALIDWDDRVDHHEITLAG